MNKADLLAKTKTELLKIAQRLGLRGVSTLNKGELADRIHEAHQRPKGSAAKHPMAAGAFAREVADAVKRRAVRRRAETDEPETAVAKVAATAKSRLERPARRLKVPAPPKPTTDDDNGATQPSTELSAHKFDISPAPPPPRQVFQEEHLGELPDAYGTGRL